MIPYVPGVPFLFVPLPIGITQRLKTINVMCKREKIALGRSIFPMKCHLSKFILKVALVILVIGDSISKQT